MSAQPLLLLNSVPPPEAWVPYMKALDLCGRSVQWLWLEVKASRITVRDTDRIQRNGRPEREILVSSLPIDAQQRYEREQAKLAAPAIATTLPLFGAPQLVNHNSPRVRVAPAQSSEADRKARVLEPLLAFRDDLHARAIYSKALRLADGSPVNSLNRMIAYQIELQRQQGIVLSERTIKRWLAAHREEGTAGLQRRRRKDADRSRYFDQREHQDAAALVAYLHLGDGMAPGLSAQACFDMLTVQRELVGLDQDDLPHYDTVRNFLAKITPALHVYCRRGRKEFGERMLPYLSRAYNEPANSIWVSDTMIADVEVMNDCIPGAKLGDPIRLRLTAIIDYRSRYIVGYSWAWEGSSASIASALRMAVSEHGPCELFYVDNGKDFCKVAAGALPGYVLPQNAEGWFAKEMRSIERTGILNRLGIRVTHCIPHHPQSKHIERFFRTLHLTFCKLWHTYTGGKPSERPDNTTALMMVHRRAQAAGDLTRSHHPLASQFMAAFEQWVERYHNHRGHRGQGMNLCSPLEVFTHARNPKQKIAPRHEDLVQLFWDYKTAKVRECQVTVNKVDYAPQDAIASRLMADRNERNVTVAYDPLNADRIAVLDADNRLVTMLERKVLVRMAPEDPETQRQIAQMSKLRSGLTRWLKEDHATIVRAGKQIGVLHPLQLLGNGHAQPAGDVLARVTPRKPKPAEATSHAPMYTNDLAAMMFAARTKK